MALFYYHDTATVRNQHQLLRCKISKWHFIIIKNYYFWIIIKNLTKCNILSTFAFKNNGKFADHILEKLCPRPWPWPQPFLSLASRVSVLKRSVLGIGFVWSCWPWPWTLFLYCLSAEWIAIPCVSTLMFIPIVLAILTRNKKRMSIPKQYVSGC